MIQKGFKFDRVERDGPSVCCWNKNVVKKLRNCFRFNWYAKSGLQCWFQYKSTYTFKGYGSLLK